MPQPNKIPRPFADSGDKNSIPDSSGSIGFASWQEGFPAITGTPFAQGGVAPKRADFNGIFNALSLATLWQQQGGFYAYDNTTDYEVGNVVEYSNDLYKCLAANGPGSAVKAPTDTTVWSKVMTAADTAATYLPLSGGTMTGVLKTSVVSVMPETGDAIAVANNTGRISVCGGKQYGQGARALIYGTQNANNPGEFLLEATNGSIFKSLNGKPDGTLTWGGKDVATIQTGTWTPTLYGATTLGAISYTTRSGVYAKIGPLVYIYANIQGTCTTAPEGQARISGLPYSSAEASGAAGYANIASSATAGYPFKRLCGLYIGSRFATLRIMNSADNTNDFAQFKPSDATGYYIKLVANDTFMVEFSGVYRTTQ